MDMARIDRMDVTSLLNSAAAASKAMEAERRESVDLTPTPSVVSNTTAASTGVATPPLDRSSPTRGSSESRTPNRSRTPWDAGGYSLPLTLDTKMSRTPSAAAVGKPLVFYSESPTGPDQAVDSANSPSSPKHRFSDSRSSLSSNYTTASSSNNSGSHSRISSLSTVSEFQPLTNLISEFGSLEAKMLPEDHHGNSRATVGGGQFSAVGGIGNNAPATGINGNSGHLDDIANAAAVMKRLGGPGASNCNNGGMGLVNGGPEMVGVDNSGTDRGGHTADASGQVTPMTSLDMMGGVGEATATATETETEARPDRAQSPSDAMLITSGSARPMMPEMGRPSADRFFAHKRAASAPDFPGLRSHRFQPSLGFTPIVEPQLPPTVFYSQATAKMSSHEDEGLYEDPPLDSDCEGMEEAAEEAAGVSGALAGSGGGGNAADHPNALPPPPAAASVFNEDEPLHCMYKDDCDTGSALRKAISHIFGRNKLCTRQIPGHVWVYYCRKHYQRSRYRSGPGYAHVQVDLVLTQIRRIQQWSDGNRRRGTTGVVTSWNLRLRKREADRAPLAPASGGNRRDPRVIAGTHMPGWLRHLVRDNYSTDDIVNIVNRIRTALDAGEISQIPDIEILPNLTSDRAEDGMSGGNGGKPKKPVNKRPAGDGSTPSGGGHHRGSSLSGDNFAQLERQGGPGAKRARSHQRDQLGPFGHHPAGSIGSSQLPLRYFPSSTMPAPSMGVPGMPASNDYMGGYHQAPPQHQMPFPSGPVGGNGYFQQGRGASTSGMYPVYHNGPADFSTMGAQQPQHPGPGQSNPQQPLPYGGAFFQRHTALNAHRYTNPYGDSTFHSQPTHNQSSQPQQQTTTVMDSSPFGSGYGSPSTGQGGFRFQQGHSRNASTPVVSTTGTVRHSITGTAALGNNNMAFSSSSYMPAATGAGPGPVDGDYQRRLSVAATQGYQQPSRHTSSHGGPSANMSGNGSSQNDNTNGTHPFEWPPSRR